MTGWLERHLFFTYSRLLKLVWKNRMTTHRDNVEIVSSLDCVEGNDSVVMAVKVFCVCVCMCETEREKEIDVELWWHAQQMAEVCPHERDEWRMMSSGLWHAAIAPQRKQSPTLSSGSDLCFTFQTQRTSAQCPPSDLCSLRRCLHPQCSLKRADGSFLLEEKCVRYNSWSHRLLLGLGVYIYIYI